MPVDLSSSVAEDSCNTWCIGHRSRGRPPDGTFIHASVIGMMGYLQANSRSDITLAVSLSANFTGSSCRSHKQALKRIGQYLKGTLEKGLLLPPTTLGTTFTTECLSACRLRWRLGLVIQFVSQADRVLLSKLWAVSSSGRPSQVADQRGRVHGSKYCSTCRNTSFGGDQIFHSVFPRYIFFSPYFQDHRS
jgi:hypothetical protein